MPRLYSVSFEDVAISVAQDLVQIKGATGKMLRIRRVYVSAVDTSPGTNQFMSLRCRFLGATVTDGSGGSTPTPKPFDPGDAAASFSALANNTTKATSSGTVNILEDNGCNIFAGYDYMFPYPPDVGPSESFVFELLQGPNGAIHLSGGVVVEEIGG
jgi:hypothetical protein